MYHSNLNSIAIAIGISFLNLAMVQFISNLMLVSTEMKMNIVFLMHSIETHAFDNFTHMFDNFTHVFNILSISHKFTHVHSSVHC